MTRLITLSISTYIGTSFLATHYYGRLYNTADDEYSSIDVERPMTHREIVAANKEAGHSVCERGDMTSRLLSEDEVHKVAIKWYKAHSDAFDDAVLLEGHFASCDPKKAIAGPPDIVARINSLWEAWETMNGWDGGNRIGARAVAKVWDELMKEIRQGGITPWTPINPLS